MQKKFSYIEKSRRIVFFAIFFCYYLGNVNAQSGPIYSAVLQGDSIVAGKTISVQDTLFFNPSLADTVKALNYLHNFIILRINEYEGSVLPDSFKVDVQLRLDYTDKDNLEDTSRVDTLSITYYKDSTYNSKTVHFLEGAYAMQIKILNISVSYADLAHVLPSLELENRIVIDRDYKMHCANHAIQTLTLDTTTIVDVGEVKVSWTPNKVSELYDVEWTYIDKSALDHGRYNISGQLSPDLIFKNNATRISTPDNNYLIPLFYDGQGSLFIRVRGSQQELNGEILPTQWSSNFASGLGRYDFYGHERELNWQASTTFAEGGKRKSVVQYFDGSLRGRQTVTNDNSTHTTVVGETFYDKQGRPVIQVMPAPTLNTLISYNPYFNVADMNGTEFEKSIYDTLLNAGDYCNDTTAKMDTVSGAAKYYSPANPLVETGFHKYIPDAKGYAYSETQYMQDNTGRIYRQSGVGKDFRIGSGREAKYYYGTPEQTDLDALFGTETGDASHYQKNLVRDANGQYSVSYIDMHGRVIATALAGEAPPSLQQLDSYRDSLQTEQLLNSSNNIIKGTKIESSKSLLVTKQGTHTFNYSLTPDTLNIQDCQAQNICYDCLYDLTITITDDCDNQLLGGSPKIVTLNRFKLFSVDTICGTVSPMDTSFSISLEPGSYMVTKTLSVNLDSMAKYRDSIYLPHNSCLTYDSIYKLQIQLIQTRIDCSQDTAEAAGYTLYREQMLLDLYPLLGQYADTAINAPGISIFDAYGTVYRYQTVTDYKDENGEIDYVLNSNGVLVRPESLTPNEFISNFKDSWAESLLPLHPEYQILLQYEQLTDSHIWDMDFKNTQTYQEALTKGYLNPTGNTTTAPANRFTVNNIDPLYGYSFTTTAKATLEDSLFHYVSTGDGTTPYLSAWGFATGLTHCSKPWTNSCAVYWNQSSNVFNSDSLCTADLDQAWVIFRGIYIEKKRQWIEHFIHAHAPTLYPQSPLVPVFPIMDSVMAQSGFSSGYDIGQDTAQSNTNLNEFYEDNCTAYVTRWWQQLNSCNYTTVDSAIIIPYLLNVCKEGTDFSQPFGASTVKPGSTYRFKSFEEVIQFYNDSTGHSTNANCTGYLIDKPLPYGNPATIINQLVITKPDDCVCERIDSIYNQYLLVSGSYANFSDYINQQFHTSISQSSLDILRSACADSSSCKYLSETVLLPPALQCMSNDICVSCKTVKHLYDSFLVKFDNHLPSIEEPDSAQQKTNQLFASYMNNKLGFNKTTVEYMDFLASCDPPIDTSHCALLKDALATYPHYYDSLTSWARPPIYDSSGCNIRYWAVSDGSNFGGRPPYLRYADFLDSGIWRHPVNDTIHTRTEFDFFGSQHDTLVGYNDPVNLCIDTAFSLEMRLKFPSNDTARHDSYTRNGGAGSWYYGTMKFEIFFWTHKLYGFFIPTADRLGTRLACWEQIWADGSVENVTDTIFSNLSFHDWQNVKFSFTDTHQTISVGDTILRSVLRSVPLGGVLNGLDYSEYGYDMEIDWMKFYDYKDSLRMSNEFNDCNHPDPGFDHTCVYDCDTTFKNYYNQKFGTSFTYNQIKNEYLACGLSITNPCTPTDSPGNLLLCGRNETMDSVILNVQDSVCSDSTSFAIITSTEIYKAYRDSLIGNFNDRYLQKCLNAVNHESFTVTHPVSEYHYTLYYYDLAGNLVKTIPPEGVHPNRDTAWLRQVREKRLAGEVQIPSHSFPTVYRYNSLNQVVSQKSPDGGLSKFWYDRLGRLVISQNAKQRAVNNYSYTRYDILGRIYEVGEKKHPNGIDNETARNQLLLKKWIEYRDFEDEYKPRFVTATFYDVPSTFASVYAGLTPFKQKSWTLRNRVSYSRYYDLLDQYGPDVVNGDTTYLTQYGWFNTAIEYNYDIHGNVDSLLNIGYAQRLLSAFGANKFKMIAYKYDLISGKVNEVHYNPGKPDEFYHRYAYDAENRLTDVYTTGMKAFVGQTGLEDHDAHYVYYKHGPLARAVLGEQQVQGLDYAYTLQGWLKGVNSTMLDPDFDMGNDGKTGSDNVNVARDVYGFNLNYFSGEYTSINSSVSPFPGHSAYLPGGGYRPLYNGNISSMAVNIGQLNQPQLYCYQYDQLNRITGMDVYRGLSGNSWSNLTATGDYKERVTYDGNGNIKKYLRQGYGATLNMDSLTYNYNANTNQLNYVRDKINGATQNSNYTVDIDDQGSNNYVYDQIGNLTKDVKEGITSITWNPYGKISEINRTANPASNVVDILYYYDPNGNRVGRDQWKSGAVAERQWFVKDAQGNTMAVYNMKYNPDWSTGPLMLKEQYMYGSSRLGVVQCNVDMSINKPTVSVNLLGPTYFVNFERGKKQYELSNHLGNVLVTVSDKKIGHDGGNGTVDYYNADVLTANDYAPFGMNMPGRKFTASSSSYRYGFNGKENDNDVKGEGNQQDYGMRIYDPRVGRFLSVDPITKKYPELTPYQFASNSPIAGVDLDGLEFYFAADGTFLGQSKKGGSAIRITTNYSTYTISKNGKKESGVVFKDFKSIDKVDATIAGKVYATIYQREVDNRKAKNIEASNETSFGFAGTDAENNITIYYKKKMDSDDGTTDKLMTDYYNAATTLNHENDHAKGLTSNGFDHFKVGMNETKYKHFSKVTAHFKENLISNLDKYLRRQENTISNFREKGDNTAADFFQKKYIKNILEYNKKFNQTYIPIDGGIYQEYKKTQQKEVKAKTN